MEVISLKINEIFYSIQGESLLAGKPTVFIRAATCNLRCTYCVAPETPILMADLTYRPISEVREGDEVVGYAQVPDVDHRRAVRTRVITLERKKSVNRVRLETALGSITCTPDHKIWHCGLKGTARYGRWKGAEHFDPGDSVTAFPVPHVSVPNREAFALGYLAGAVDGGGCFWDFAPSVRKNTYLKFRIAVNDVEMLNRFREYGELFGFEFSGIPHGYIGPSGSLEKMPSLYLLGGDKEVQKFREVLRPKVENDSYLRGYISGIFDSEGSFSCGILRISQCAVNEEIRARIFDYATRLGFTCALEEKTIIIKGGLEQHLRFFALCEPAISRKRNAFFGGSVQTSSDVLSISPAEDGPVITLTTECGSFVANGLVVKNCDTRYAFWEGSVMSLDQILAKVKEHETQYVCITGGEPLGQRAVIPLMEKLLAEGYTVSLETNGSFSVKSVPLDVIKVIDIKCPDSGESDSMAWENLELVRPHDQFKFVIASRSDFDWSQRICEDHGLYEKCAVLFSPVYGKVKPVELAEWILDAKKPVTMQLQMHKEIWGPNERGV